ncbi:MAG: membrane protein insertion efficiency factor YidD [Epsilonproteobacteria bacterium]|nr:membrane protein insertion efficiency factor YidD [Campylobacterota bacterium]
MVRTFLLKVLWIYQKFFTLIGYGSCRYYPTCSEYAKIHFENSPISTAFYHTFIRILRCNQLFEGGIDYPTIKKNNFCPKNMGIEEIKYWLVPKGKNHFYMIKNFSFKG